MPNRRELGYVSAGSVPTVNIIANVVSVDYLVVGAGGGGGKKGGGGGAGGYRNSVVLKVQALIQQQKRHLAFSAILLT